MANEISAKKWPNFFILGAQKAGTSSLYHYLKQHPQIYMSPIKEAKFFLKENPSEEDKKEYLELFEGAENYPVRGEATPLYLSGKGVAERMHEKVPDARMVVILRDPVERAYSAFLMTRRQGTEPLSSFADVVKAEPERRERREGHLYLWHSRYYTHLERYFEYFDRGQFKIYFFRELKKRTNGLVKDILNFLSVSKDIELNTSKKHNKGGIPVSDTASKFLKSKNSTTKKIIKKLIPKKNKSQNTTYDKRLE